MEFSSDNTTGASAKILAAIVAANEGSAAPYGADPLTARAQARLGDVFEHELSAHLVATGTGANALALGAMCPPWGAVFCHEDAHIFGDECGAPELFTAGAKVVGIAGFAGKITSKALSETLKSFPRGPVRQVQPAVLSLSQLSENGTAYSCAEIAALSAVAHDAGLAVHMDGARFANALVAIGSTPAEMSWKAGIDVLSFGATKNGAFACEAVIFFDRAKATSFEFQRKRGGHVVSKGRLIAAQMLAYLDEDHWLDLARMANQHAAAMIAGLTTVPGVRLPWRCDANEVFAILPRKVDGALRAAGAHYYDWRGRGHASDTELAAGGEVLVRLVTSFATDPTDIARFVEIARSA
jgi:threonine aldolase